MSTAKKQEQENPVIMSVVKEPAQLRLKIKKSKLNQRTKSLAVVYEKHFEDGSISEVTEDCPHMVHMDLEEAFKSLRPHLVILCDLRERVMEIGDIDPDEYGEARLENISVSGVSYNASMEGITLIGSKRTDKSKIMNMNSPYTAFDSDYEFVDDLKEKVNKVVDETLQYLHGKITVQQISMEFDEAGDPVF